MDRSVSHIFVTNVRAICKSNNIQIGKLEDRVGVSPGYLSRIHGGKSIGLDVCIAICDYLEVCIDDMIDPDMIIQLELAYHKLMVSKLEKQL